MAEKTPTTPDAVEGIGRRFVGWTRFLAIGPVLGLLIGAVTLIVMASIDSVRIVSEILKGSVPLKIATVEFIEIADVYLLAVVLYVMALGLFELFVDDRLPLPHWLEFHSLEDLKEKLVGVVVVVMGVFFLGRVINMHDYLQLLYLGLGMAAIIASLTYFVSGVLGKNENKMQ
jgi:uncharacterized membrane protein YqhA